MRIRNTQIKFLMTILFGGFLMSTVAAAFAADRQLPGLPPPVSGDAVVPQPTPLPNNSQNTEIVVELVGNCQCVCEQDSCPVNPNPAFPWAIIQY